MDHLDFHKVSTPPQFIRFSFKFRGENDQDLELKYLMSTASLNALIYLVGKEEKKIGRRLNRRQKHQPTDV